MAARKPYKITGPNGQPVTYYGVDGTPLPEADDLSRVASEAESSINSAPQAGPDQYPQVIGAPSALPSNPIGQALNISGAPVQPPVKLKSDTAVDPSALAEEGPLSTPGAPRRVGTNERAQDNGAQAIIDEAMARDKASTKTRGQAGPPRDPNGLAITSQKYEYEAPVPLSEEQSAERKRLSLQMDKNNEALDQLAAGSLVNEQFRQKRAEAAAQEAFNNQMQAQQMEEARLAQKQARLNELKAKADALEAEARNAKEPTSSDHWSRGGDKGGVLGTIMAGLNVFMSAMGGKYMRSNGGHNVWTEQIDKQVSEYVADQRREYERGQGRAREAKNDYAKQLAAWGDPDDAAQALKVQKLNLLSNYMRQRAEVPSDQERMAKIQQGVLMLDQMSLQAKQQLINNGTQKVMEERTIPKPVYTGGGGSSLKTAAQEAEYKVKIKEMQDKYLGKISPEKVAEMVPTMSVRLSRRLFGGETTFANPTMVAKINDTQRAADSILGLTDMLENAAGKGDELRYRETFAELQSMYGAMAGETKDLYGLGAITGPDLELVRSQTGEAKRLKFNEMKSKIDTFKRILVNKARASASGTYRDLEFKEAYDPPEGK